MRRKLDFIYFLLSLLVLVLLLPIHSFAASGFPEIISGQTKVTMSSSGQTFYGGMTGNYAVLNADTDASYGFHAASGVGLFRPGCLFQTFDSISGACFVLGTGHYGETLASSDRLMTSQTKVDGTTVYEIPALLFSGINVNGDVSSGLDYLKFWKSQNLNQNNTDNADGSAWNFGTYAFNPNAQIVRTSAQFGQYKDKLLTLAGGGADLPYNTGPFLTGGPVSLQGNSIIDTTNVEKSKYPDGKVWTVTGGTGDLTIKAGRQVTYSGVGTIIIKGNFTLESGASIVPADQNSRLGIIVLGTSVNLNTKGKCAFSGNNKLTAMTYCENTFTTSGNGEFIGSFVAPGFSIAPDKSVLFDYDPTFDEKQPPGFRNLSIPGTTEIGNKQ